MDPEEIPVFAPEDTSVDDRDMFTVEEVQAMREAIDSPRERCLFELLAFTGQRIRAIQTLRIKDIDLEEGVLYLNESEGGSKVPKESARCSDRKRTSAGGSTTTRRRSRMVT